MFGLHKSDLPPFRHWSDEQTHRRRLTWFFVFLGAVWMAILGYLAVAAHVTFFAAVNPALVIDKEAVRVWCIVAPGIALGLWLLVTVLLWSSAAGMLPRLVGSKPAAGRDEQRLANVVEEMTLASGESRPRWYVLESQACNAFAVGRSTEKGAVVVTRGLLQSLTRDELQAVVAHELAHLKNGDAQFVVQALAFAYVVLAGCTVAAAVVVVMGLVMAGLAWLAFRIAAGTGNAWVQLVAAVTAVYIVVMGIAWIFSYVLIVGAVLALVIIGVKAAASAIGQSREYLADAGAVQFTRNPLALASALKKVAGVARVDGLPGAAVASLWLEQGRAEREDGLPQRLFSFLIHTHPPAQRRLEVLKAMAGSSVTTEAQWLRAVRAGPWQRFTEWALPMLATALAVVVIPTMSQIDLWSRSMVTSLQHAYHHREKRMCEISQEVRQRLRSPDMAHPIREVSLKALQAPPTRGSQVTLDFMLCDYWEIEDYIWVCGVAVPYSPFRAVARSKDGGKTYDLIWQETRDSQDHGATYGNHIFFVDKDIGFLSIDRDYSRLYKTIDGGEHWKEILRIDREGGFLGVPGGAHATTIQKIRWEDGLVVEVSKPPMLFGNQIETIKLDHAGIWTHIVDHKAVARSHDGITWEKLR